MRYELPFCCPMLSPKYFCVSTICPCYVSSVLYARIFKRKSFSLFGFFLIPFSAYGIRRYVIDKMHYNEEYEISAIKSTCFCFSLTQDLHEMNVRRIGVYKYLEEPYLYDDNENKI